MIGRSGGKELAQYVLGRAELSQLVDETRSLLEALGTELDVAAAEAIASYLTPLVQSGGDTTALAELRTPTARYLQSRILAASGQAEAALAALTEAIDASSPVTDPNVLLQRARILAKGERYGDAANDLRLALALHPSYPFFARCERLLDRIVASGQWASRRTARLAVLASSTTAMLVPVLRAAAFRCGIALDVYEGLHGNYVQEILDPNSGLYRFAPDLVLVLVNHRDLCLAPDSTPHQAREAARELRRLWGVLAKRHPCHIIQAGFDIQPGGSWGNLEDRHCGRRNAIREANATLCESLPAGVSFLDTTVTASEVGPDFWSDRQWCATKQYPSTTALPRLADHVLAHCRSVLGLASKVLVLDLDNTLWGGVIGEDLLRGIRIGPPSPEGEGYLELQRYAKDLQRRGILLAVCSKNNLDDAERPFREHESMHLRLDDFVAFRANWQDKASNLRSIAEELSLGLDSFVFLDDNPMERALVRKRLPEVAVPECGNDPWQMLAVLRHEMYFESVSLTTEDTTRHQSYRSNRQRKAIEASAPSLDDFVAQLQMRAEHGPVDEHTLTRVTQLVNKTNQFNLTTRRYTEEQLREMAGSDNWWCRWFRLRDRFGDHGLIGVLLARREPARWTVDTWLMSCRVLGRNMEQFMSRCLLTAARQAGAREVIGLYLPTAKNALVSDLYQRLQFEASPGDSCEYRFDLKANEPTQCPFIRSESDREPASMAKAA